MHTLYIAQHNRKPVLQERTLEMLKSVVIVLVFAMSLAGRAPVPVDVTGIWDFQVETQQGSGTPVFTFKQEGEKLTGQYKGIFGESALTGTVKGNAIEFSFKVSGDVEGTLVYTGTVDGDTAKGKVKFAELGDGTWSGKKRK